MFSWAWHSTPERESLVTISMKPEGGGTLLTFHHEQFFDEAARDNHERGWTELLDKLESYLKLLPEHRSRPCNRTDRLPRGMDRRPQSASCA